MASVYYQYALFQDATYVGNADDEVFDLTTTTNNSLGGVYYYIQPSINGYLSLHYKMNNLSGGNISINIGSPANYLQFSLNTPANNLNLIYGYSNFTDGNNYADTLTSVSVPSPTANVWTQFQVFMLNQYITVMTGNNVLLTNYYTSSNLSFYSGGLSVSGWNQGTKYSTSNLTYEPMLTFENDAYFAQGIYADRYYNINYNDLINKPTIASQVNSDWNAVSGVAQILNKPTIPNITAGNTSNETITAPWISLNSNIISTVSLQSNSNILATNYLNCNYSTCCYDSTNQYLYVGAMVNAGSSLVVKNLDGTSTSVTIPSHTYRQYVILKYDYNGNFISWTTIRMNAGVIVGYQLKIFGNYLYFVGYIGGGTSGAIAYHFSTTSSLASSPFTTSPYSFGTDVLVVRYNVVDGTAQSWWMSGIPALDNNPNSPNGADITSLIVDNNNNIFIGVYYTANATFTTNRFNTSSTVGTKSSFTLPASAVSSSIYTYAIFQFDSSGIPTKWNLQLAHELAKFGNSLYACGVMNNIYNFTSTTIGSVVKYLGGESGIVKYDTTTGNALSWTSVAGAFGTFPNPPSIVIDNSGNLYWTFKGFASGVYNFYTTTKPSSSGSLTTANATIVKFSNDTVSSFLQLGCELRLFNLYADVGNNIYLVGLPIDNGASTYAVPSFYSYSKTLALPNTSVPPYQSDYVVIKWQPTGEVKNMLYINTFTTTGADQIKLATDDALNLYIAVGGFYNQKLGLNEFGVKSMVSKKTTIGAGTGSENYIIKYNERGELGNYNVAYYLPIQGNAVNEKKILIDNRYDLNLTIVGSNLNSTKTVESYDISNKQIIGSWTYDKYVLSGQQTNYLDEEKASIVKTLDIDYNCLYVAQQQNADGLKIIDASQFYRRTANSSSITTALTNVFGASPFIRRSAFYQFEYNIIFTNSTTGAITLGWNSTDITNAGTAYIYAIVKVMPSNATSTSLTITTYNSTANKVIGGGSTGTYLMTIKGFLLTNNSLYLPLVCSVSAGTLTILSGSHFKLTNRGYLSTIGNIA